MTMKITQWKPGQQVPTRGILLIRHGRREDPDIPPLTAMLTPEGKKASLNCGILMRNNPPRKVYSSPVQRCMDTGRNIIQGAGWDLAVQGSEMLGDPGPFVIGKTNVLINEMVAYAQKNDDWSFLQNHIDGMEIPGMRHRKVGSDALVEALYPTGDGFVLCVSHDSIIAAVQAAFGLESASWPDPLNGCIIERKNNQI